MTVTATQMEDVTGDNYVSPVGRLNTAADTYYQVQLKRGPVTKDIRLFKTVAGTFTQLGSTYTGFTPTNSTPFTLTLSMSGTSITAKVNGSVVIGPITDSDISAAGKAALYNFVNSFGDIGNTHGVQVDGISADDASSSGGKPATYYAIQMGA